MYGHRGSIWSVKGKNESDKEHARTATLACMVLHNVCLMQRDSIPRKLDLTVGPDGDEIRNRDEIRKLLLVRECRSMHDVSGEATRVRLPFVESYGWRKKLGEFPNLIL